MKTKRWAAGLFIVLVFMYNHLGGLAQGETSAKAACIMEMETGRVLFEYNMRARLPMASTTKVMTALAGAGAGQPGEPGDLFGKRVRRARNIHLSGGGRNADASGDAVWGCMLASGNDAAVAISGAYRGKHGAVRSS